MGKDPKEKDKTSIPRGCYCYDENGLCPYWNLKEDLPEQYNGYCGFLGKTDMDLAREMEMKNLKTGEVCQGDELPIPVSLLWDQCKMCGVNDDDDSLYLVDEE
jgi:hypothetical protein